MSLENFDYVEEDNDEDDLPQTNKNIRQSKLDIRKSKINMRASKVQLGSSSQINMMKSFTRVDLQKSSSQLKPSTIADLGLYQANPEDVWTTQDHAEAIKYIQQFTYATSLLDENLPIYEQIKEYCKNRKNRQLLILNDFHLYLRDAYKEKFDKQQIILETIYQISLEKDFCDELALLGGLIDEAFVFLQTHLKSYNKTDVDDYYNKQEKNVLQQHDVEIIDSATLLKLDLWIRIIVNFCKNDEVIDYVSKNKEDVIKYLLIFLQNIDAVIKKNPNLSSINSVIIASTVKTGVLEILFLLTQIDDMRNKIIFNQSYFSAIYVNLLKKTSNQTLFSNLCKLVSQLAVSEKFPIHILGLNIIEDFIFSYMMRVVYNVGLTNNDQQDSTQSSWNAIQQERQARQYFLAEVGLARTFFYLTVNKHQRKLLIKSINDYEDHILFRFLFKCYENNQNDALIYMILGLTQLVQKEQLRMTKEYHKWVVIFIYQQCEQVYIEKDTIQEKQKMLITILMTRLIRYLNFNKDDVEKLLELMNVKLNNTLKVPGTILAPQLQEEQILQEMRKKKIKKYEENDEVYQKQIQGYDVQGLIIKERPYSDSVDYSRLISEISEGDFDDSLLENEIYHLRINGKENIKQQIDDKKQTKSGQIVKKAELEKQQIFNFEKDLYPKYANTNNNETNPIQTQQNMQNSFLDEQLKLIDRTKGNPKNDPIYEKDNLSFGITPIGSNKNENPPASFNVSSINNQNQNFNSQSDDIIKEDLKALGKPSKFKTNPYNQQSYEYDQQPNNPQDSDSQNQINSQNNYRNSLQNNQFQDFGAQNNNQINQAPSQNDNQDYNSNQRQRDNTLNVQRRSKLPNQRNSIRDNEVLPQKEPEQFLYLNGKKQCFQFHVHYKRRCEYCQSIFYSFFDQPNILIEQWIFNSQNCSYDELFSIDFFYENFIQIVHSLFYFTMTLKGELPQSMLKQICILLADENKQYNDRRYKAAIILLLSHIIQINPIYINRLIQINFLCVQDFVLTQFLNCFGYKTINLLQLIKRGTGTVNRQPIFQQVQRRGSKLSTLNDDELEGEDKDNVYENYVIQSTLLLEFDGTQFNTNEVTLSTKQSTEFIKSNMDKVIETPDHLSNFNSMQLKYIKLNLIIEKEQYTDYNLQLHIIQHVLDLTYRLFKQALKQKNELILEGAPNFIEQLVYLLIFFNDINSFDGPKLPFYPKTNCWRQNKILIQKGFSTVVNIIKSLIVKKSVISEYYKTVQKFKPHLLEVIKMAEFFPSFKGSILLFSIVYSIYNFKSLQNEELDHYDLQCFSSGLRSSASAQRLYQAENKGIFNFEIKQLRSFIQNPNNEQKLGRLLKFQIICLQFFCTFNGKKVLKVIQNEIYQNLDIFLHELKTVLELCKKLEEIRSKKNLNIKSMQDLGIVVNGKRIATQATNLGQESSREQSQLYKTIGNLDGLVSDFQSSVMLFLNMLSEFRHFSDPILSHPTFHFIIRNIKHLHLSNEAQFCFSATIHSLAKTNVCLDNLQRHYKEFSQDITNLLYEGKLSKNNLMPIFRSVRFLLQNRKRDSQYFREMIPKLREYAEITQNANLDVKQLQNQLGNLNISAIGQNQQQLSNSQQQYNSQADNLTFIDQKSFLQMMNPNGKRQAQSFLENEEMTFLQNMKQRQTFMMIKESNSFQLNFLNRDDNESASQNLNETISMLSKNKKITEMSQIEKKALFKEMFVKEARLLLKLLVVISENELQEKIKDMKLNKEFKIDEAGILSKKTQKQQIDLEENKRNLISIPHNESSIYGYDMKINYELPLSRVPDFYKKSAYDLYEERKKQKEKQEMRDNEPIPIVKFKDDSESTFIKIKNNQINDVLEKKPEFLLEKQFNYSMQKLSPQKGYPQEPNRNRYSSQPAQDSLDMKQKNNQQVESLAQFMKQQQEKQYYQNQINAKNILPADFSSLSSIRQPNDNQNQRQNSYNQSQPSYINKQSQNTQSNIFSNEYSVLKHTGQNILSDVDDIYKKMYQKKLFQK